MFWCPSAETYVVDGAHGARDVSTSARGSEDGSAAIADDRTTEVSVETLGDASGAVAEKLLSGWTLTGDACPMPGCHTPLVRNSAGEMFCARHAMYVRAESAVSRPPAGTAAAAATNANAGDGQRRSVRGTMIDADVIASERRTFDALEAKLERAREALERSVDPEDTRSYLRLIDDLHASMKALQTSPL
ncbi:hypothetical protein BE221DRAFT_103506 [Ostreococcus tauri]|nr:hypothetical protein BE221DRAFT_103506 [Ostreococcus tauri]